MKEIWKSVPGTRRRYWVSDHGRVWSRAKGRFLGGMLHPRGYRFVRFRVPGGRSFVASFHGAVMLAFVGRRQRGMEIRHIDGDAQNNSLGNLRYGTSKENGEDMVRHGRSTRGERQPAAKLTSADVRIIRRMRRSGITAERVARKFGVARQTITNIDTGHRWSHLL